MTDEFPIVIIDIYIYQCCPPLRFFKYKCDLAIYNGSLMTFSKHLSSIVSITQEDISV